ncbi:MAG: hypothetical protein WC870_03350, partial [Candidatus Paceibacterota bacterium]
MGYLTIRDFLKKIGSNFRIAERTLSFPLKNAWILAGKYHAEAQRAEATSYDFAKSTNWRRGRDSSTSSLFYFLPPSTNSQLLLNFTNNSLFPNINAFFF